MIKTSLDSIFRDDISIQESEEIKKYVYGTDKYNKINGIGKYSSRQKKDRYPKEFKQKRKLLLDGHRKIGGCEQCNTKKYLTVHHVDEDVLNNSDSNLKVLCWSCHSEKHSHMHSTPPKWMKK